MNITRQISKYNYYSGNNIKYIVLHYVGANSTAKNNADYFGGGDRSASAHYFVDDKSIYQVVEDYNGSWSVGNTRTEVNNKNSINIEMCLVNGEVTGTTEKNTIELVKSLMNKYNISISNIRTHAEVTNYSKTCPNWSDNNWQRWKEFKNKLTGNTIIEKPMPPAAKPSGEYEINEYSESGKCTIVVKEGVYFYNTPYISTINNDMAYEYGESVYYDYVVITNKYVYISWISASTGIRRYMPVLDKINNERWGNCI